MDAAIHVFPRQKLNSVHVLNADEGKVLGTDRAVLVPRVARVDAPLDEIGRLVGQTAGIRE